MNICMYYMGMVMQFFFQYCYEIITNFFHLSPQNSQTQGTEGRICLGELKG